MQALELIPQVQEEFKAVFGRDSGGLVRPYRCEDAETIVVALGSIVGTIKDVVDERREAGDKIGVLSICSFRPFPIDAVREVLKGAKRTVCFEKAFSVGIGGIVSSHLRAAMRGKPFTCFEVIGGLGGRNITKNSLHQMLDQAEAETLEGLTFLDLDMELVNAELEREAKMRRSGGVADNVMRHAVQRADAAIAAQGEKPQADKVGNARVAAPSTADTAINV